MLGVITELLNLYVGRAPDLSANLFSQALEVVRGRIDERQFQIFDLYVMKSWSAEDVAHTLGISVARVYLAKHRISAMVTKETRRLEKQIENAARHKD